MHAMINIHTGLAKPQYEVLFPTLYAKLAAIMIDWGVADMEKLGDLAVVRSNKSEI